MKNSNISRALVLNLCFLYNYWIFRQRVKFNDLDGYVLFNKEIKQPNGSNLIATIQAIFGNDILARNVCHKAYLSKSNKKGSVFDNLFKNFTSYLLAGYSVRFLGIPSRIPVYRVRK